jgi:hypothetical protein
MYIFMFICIYSLYICISEAICGLFNDAVSSLNYIANDRMINYWKGYGRKKSWPNLRYYPFIRL